MIGNQANPMCIMTPSIFLVDNMLSFLTCVLSLKVRLVRRICIPAPTKTSAQPCATTRWLDYVLNLHVARKFLVLFSERRMLGLAEQGKDQESESHKLGALVLVLEFSTFGMVNSTVQLTMNLFTFSAISSSILSRITAAMSLCVLTRCKQSTSVLMFWSFS